VYRRDDDGVIAELRRLSGTDTALLGDEELLRMILPAIRSDYRAIETYPRQDGPGLSCPVTALTGDADPEVTLDEAQAWREHTTGEFSMLVFPGGHFFLVSERARVTEAILERLRVHA
jgi:surfactin synthase thioesterase subunit